MEVDNTSDKFDDSICCSEWHLLSDLLRNSVCLFYE